MKFSISKKRAVLAVALSSAVGAAAFAGIAGTAKADPMQYNALAGVGSDTIQDVTNAFAGFTNGVDYTPLHSSSASGYKQIVSFDAITPGTQSGVDCITSQINGPAYLRPNGSGAGQKALSRSIDATGWGAGSSCGLQDTSGQIQFSRSSSGVSTTGTVLSYIPFARDGVTFAYYQKTNDGTNAVITSFTRKQLIDLYTNGPTVINGVRVVPCGIQSGSGTFKFWNKVTTSNASESNSNEASATTFCNGLVSNNLSGRAEENNSFSLKARGDAAAATSGHENDEVIIGFSAASFAAKYNGAAPCGDPVAANNCSTKIATGVALGSITDDGITGTGGANPGAPLSLSGGKLVPNATYYNNGKVGRNVYFIVPAAVINSAGNTNLDIKSIFKGTNSAVCQATSTISAFGFLPLDGSGDTCGDTTTYINASVSGQ
jgi:hypothetical protein